LPENEKTLFVWWEGKVYPGRHLKAKWSELNLSFETTIKIKRKKLSLLRKGSGTEKE